MKIPFRLVVLFTLALTNFCISAHANETSSKLPVVSLISMQRTWCFGTCPIDSITLSSDGAAVYSGIANTDRIGRYTGRFDPAVFFKLMAWLEGQNFFAMKDEVGYGNADASDLIVSVTRKSLPYTVAFRIGGNLELRKRMENAITNASKDIVWKKDEAASYSGVKGSVGRALTSSEKEKLPETHKNVMSFPIAFANVYAYPAGRHQVRRSTRSDASGRFQLFLPPGRYLIQVNNYNLAKSNRERRNPFQSGLSLPSQDITVEPAQFAEVTFRSTNKVAAKVTPAAPAPIE